MWPHGSHAGSLHPHPPTPDPLPGLSMFMSVKTPSSAETAVPGFVLKAGVAAVCADWVGENEMSDAYHCISPPKTSNRAGASPMPPPPPPSLSSCGSTAGSFWLIAQSPDSASVCFHGYPIFGPDWKDSLMFRMVPCG